MPPERTAEPAGAELRQAATRRAFDRVAAEYDGPAGNNVVIRRMRTQLWRAVEAAVPAGARLLDLGCGTGLDAAHFAARGYRVLAVDSSPAMVERTRRRLDETGLTTQASVRTVGLDELQLLRGEEVDGIYSDLGPLNCAADLGSTAHVCASLLRPGGRMVVSVIGQICPWEIVYYLLHGKPRRALVRLQTGPVPVPLGGETVWTRYYTPRRFHAAFAPDFELTAYRALRLLASPPYLLGMERRLRPVSALGEWLDERLGGLPPVRNAGDSFLLVMTRRG